VHPELDAGVSRTDLTLLAGGALIAAGEADRAAELVGEAYEQHTGDLAERAALVASMVKSRLLADAFDVGTDTVRQAISWVGEDGPTALLADLRATLARALLDDEDFDGAVLAATEASVLGRELDLPEVVTDALTTLARLDDFTGDPQRAERSMQEVVAQARSAGDSIAELRAMHQLARVQARMDHHRDAYLTHVAGWRRAIDTGRTTHPFGHEHRVFGSLLALMVGQWRAADQLLDTKAEKLPPRQGADLAAVRGLVARPRDEISASIDDALLALYERIREHSGGLAAAELKHGRCGGCRLELNPTDLAAIDKAASNEVVRCEECTRILVRTHSDD
ncbi:MAG: C4-type zinc ribbon domain-containing protein, partial [Janibacter sp.]|nr:C4-type zinc ribbon domain-containing protein [Janibacter sp.]